MGLGFGEIMLILLFAVMIFGPKKLPELGKAAGHTLREFKNAMGGITGDDSRDHKK
ncbi:MAG TPA: twin-arginine translocase TatA/TatE family subunit [Bacillales bacterium]|nr:twin-arginine translocase TatA/TatE family subunit [Bacillales bacterium]